MPRSRITPPRGLVVEQFAADEDLVLLSWPSDDLPVDRLSVSEREVLAAIVRGESNADIAGARKTSVRTIANQVASILRKTGASSRFDLIRRGAKQP